MTRNTVAVLGSFQTGEKTGQMAGNDCVHGGCRDKTYDPSISPSVDRSRTLDADRAWQVEKIQPFYVYDRVCLPSAGAGGRFRLVDTSMFCGGCFSKLHILLRPAGGWGAGMRMYTTCVYLFRGRFSQISDGNLIMSLYPYPKFRLTFFTLILRRVAPFHVFSVFSFLLRLINQMLFSFCDFPVR